MKTENPETRQLTMVVGACHQGLLKNSLLKLLNPLLFFNNF